MNKVNKINKLVAFDLETTGVDPNNSSVIQIGAAIFDSETCKVLNTFEVLVRPDNYNGHPYALAMNSELLYKIAADKGNKIKNFNGSKNMFKKWLHEHVEGKPYAVGFNVGSFDLQFGFKDLFNRRTIELGVLLMHKFNKKVPVTSRQWHDLERKEVAHTALADCLEAVNAYKYAVHNLFSDKSTNNFKNKKVK